MLSYSENSRKHAHVDHLTVVSQGAGVLNGAPGTPVVTNDVIVRRPLISAGGQAQHQGAQKQENAELSHGSFLLDKMSPLYIHCTVDSDKIPLTKG